MWARTASHRDPQYRPIGALIHGGWVFRSAMPCVVTRAASACRGVSRLCGGEIDWRNKKVRPWRRPTTSSISRRSVWRAVSSVLMVGAASDLASLRRDCELRAGRRGGRCPVSGGRRRAPRYVAWRASAWQVQDHRDRQARVPVPVVATLTTGGRGAAASVVWLARRRSQNMVIG